MGCTESVGQIPLLYTNIDSQLKKKMIQVISADNISALAQLQAKESFPANIELSDDRKMWTSIHYCCRFDSPCCLDYLLKKCYLENVKQYIYFVNQQTSEGLTCLHLCSIWGSYKCVALLLKYGGINLSLLDNKKRSVEFILKDNGPKDMEQTVVKLKAKEGHITQWNFRLLHQFLDITKLRNLEFHQQQLKLIQNKESKNESTTQSHYSEEQAKLWLQKRRLQSQSDQIYSQIKLKIQQINKQKGQSSPQLQKGITVSTENVELQQKIIKNQQILILEQQLELKEQQIQRLKLSIRKTKSQRVGGKLELQNQQIDQQAPQTKDSLNQFTNQFSAYRQELRKNKTKYIPVPKVPISVKQHRMGKEAKGSQPNLAANQMQADANFKNLPENVKQRYRKAKEKGSFQDQQFPHNDSSFGGAKYQQKIKGLPPYSWFRPNQFVSPNFVLFDGIQPDDIKQGLLGTCYFLATISQFARQPQRVIDVFQFYDIQIGFYVLRLYTNGKPNYVIIDDYFPCSSVSKQPLFSRPNGKQIWVLLLEKAWVKTIGSYFSAQAMAPADFIDDLTGGPAIGAFFKQKTDKTKDINIFSPKKKLIVLSSNRQKMEGIVSYHAYSLLKVIENNGSYIYKLRNPWGRFEWSGCYSDQSPQWTPQLRIKCEQKNGDDGVFFMSERQLIQTYEYYTIQLGQPNQKYNYLQLQSQPEQMLFFKFRLTKKGMMSVKLTQFFDRMLRDKDSQYKYSPVVFELGKIVQNGVKFLSQGNSLCSLGGKSVFACQELYKQYQSGDYFIRLTVQWVNPQKYNTAVVSVFCGEPVTIQRIQYAEGFTLWRQMLMNFAQNKQLKEINKNAFYALQWMKGQLVCYASINPASQDHCHRIKWNFDSKAFLNCKISINKSNENGIQFFVDKNQKCNFGTLDRAISNSGLNTGSISVESLKAQLPKVNPIQPIVQQTKPLIQQQQPQKQQIQQPQKQQQEIKNIKKQEPIDNRLNKLPEDIKQKYKKAKQKGFFDDQQFPHDQSSLGGEQLQEKIQPFLEKLVWLRPTQFLKPNYSLLNGISPDDVKQGKVDNPYCLASLAGYARNPEKIVDIFQFYDLQVGFYVLKFYINGRITFIVVDDYIPCDSSKNQPLFASPVGNKLWVLIIEKAWAKIFGSYFNTEQLYADSFMEDLTGSPTYGTFFQRLQNKTEWLVNYSAKNYCIVFKTGTNQIQGIQTKHDYTLLKIIENKGSNIYKVRNPWAMCQWNGQYGEKSSLWTPELRKKCDQKNGDDGVFFLSEKQMLLAFEYYSVGLYEPNFKYSYAEFESQPEESIYFKFKLSKQGNFAIKVTQQFISTSGDQQYKYSPVIFELGKIENNEVIFFNQGQNQCAYGEKSVYITDNLYDQYEPGEYFIRIKVNWVLPQSFNSAVLSVYGGESVNIERIKQAQGIKLWKQMASNFMQDKQLSDLDENISYGMEWMKGQMVCYATIRQNGEASNYKLKWTFKAKEFKNCKLALNKKSQNVIEYIIDKKEGYNIGTINIIQNGQECGTGDAQVVALKV